MSLRMYSVFDSAACVYFAPFCVVNDDVARRYFIEVMSDSSTPISKTPSDYSLYSIGLFNPADGVVIADDPRLLLSGRAAWDAANL